MRLLDAFLLSLVVWQKYVIRNYTAGSVMGRSVQHRSNLEPSTTLALCCLSPFSHVILRHLRLRHGERRFRECSVARCNLASADLGRIRQSQDVLHLRHRIRYLILKMTSAFNVVSPQNRHLSLAACGGPCACLVQGEDGDRRQ